MSVNGTDDAPASLADMVNESNKFDPYHKWFGIPSAEQPPHYYRLLRIAVFESDLDVIDHAYDTAMAELKRQEAGAYGDLVEQLGRELLAARRCLLDPQKRAEYDRTLRKQMSPDENLGSAPIRQRSSPPPLAETRVPAQQSPEMAASAPFVRSAPPTTKPVASGHNSSSRKPIIVPLLVGGIACAILVTIGIVVGRLSLDESPNPTTPPALAKDPVGKTTPSSSVNGRTTNWTIVDWTPHGPRNWGAVNERNDIYVAKETTPNSWLLSRRSFSDFVLTAKFAVSEGGAGGIYVHVPPDARFPWNQGFEIHFADDYGEPPSIEGTGSVWKKAQPLSNQARPVNQWSDVRITCRGRDLTVWVNDECVVEYQIPDDFPTSGHIGLDGVTGGITYRDIQIQPLSTDDISHRVGLPP